MSSRSYRNHPVTGGVPLKIFAEGVPVDPGALTQLENVARLPIVHGSVAVMPDVHVGYGAAIGAVIPTRSAIIPSAVGVDIGCGMMAQRTTLKAKDLPDSLASVRSAIEAAVPHGRSRGGRRGDSGAWQSLPAGVEAAWVDLEPGLRAITAKHPAIAKANSSNHLGTLGGGNHFVELCLDEEEHLWVMLHSGSRGVGNRIGTHFISLAKEERHRIGHPLPDTDLAYFSEGSTGFEDYVEAVSWAQAFARRNRELMMRACLVTLGQSGLPTFSVQAQAINCHHNYVQEERHGGDDVYITRKGAVSARRGELGIIPGSMGTASFIVRGRGHADSFESCSHGAGRRMSRTAARKRFSVAEHARATAGVECRKDAGVLDETPSAYKDIEAVMHAQRALVDVVHRLKQVVCVKG